MLERSYRVLRTPAPQQYRSGLRLPYQIHQSVCLPLEVDEGRRLLEYHVRVRTIGKPSREGGCRQSRWQGSVELEACQRFGADIGQTQMFGRVGGGLFHSSGVRPHVHHRKSPVAVRVMTVPSCPTTCDSSSRISDSRS